MPTIVSQIQTVEQHLQSCRQRRSSIQNTLRTANHSNEERERLEQEMRTVGDEVETAEKELSSLRKENRKTMFVSVFIFILLALLYWLFIMT